MMISERAHSDKIELLLQQAQQTLELPLEHQNPSSAQATTTSSSSTLNSTTSTSNSTTSTPYKSQKAKLRSNGGLVPDDATKEEEELIKRKRAVIITFNGIFRFSKDLLLNCIPCDIDLPNSTLATLDEDVNAHTTSMEHLMAWSSFVKRESDGINKLLSSAIQDGVFVSVCDGYVRCNVCNNVISDSLAFLKRHLFNEKHRFRGAPLPMEAINTYANPYGQAARKLTSLVSSHPDLDFVTDKGSLVVNCTKCEKLMPRGYSEVHRHLKSKMHTSAQRKKRISGEGGYQLDEVITLSDEEGGNHRDSTGGSRTRELASAVESIGGGGKRARTLNPTTTANVSASTRSRSTNKVAAAAASRNFDVDGVRGRTRGGAASSKASKTHQATTTTSSNIIPVRRTFGGRGRPKVIQHQHQHQTATIEMTTADGSVTEGHQIILMQAEPAEDDGTGEDHQGHQKQRQVVHLQQEGDDQSTPHYAYIEVISEEHVEFVDGDGNAHTATVIASADGQPTTAIWGTATLS